jgi:hypothetical protein
MNKREHRVIVFFSHSDSFPPLCTPDIVPHVSLYFTLVVLGLLDSIIPQALVCVK